MEIAPLESSSCRLLKQFARAERSERPFVLTSRLTHWLRGAPPKELFAFLQGTSERKSYQVREGEQTVAFMGFEPIDWVWRNAGLWLLWDPRLDGPQGILPLSLDFLLSQGFRHLNLHRLHCKVARNDTSGFLCLLGEGFTCEGAMRKHRRVGNIWHDEILMGILEREWHAPRKTS